MSRHCVVPALALLLSVVVSGCGTSSPSDRPAAAPDSAAAPVGAPADAPAEGGGPAPIIEVSASPEAPTRVLDPRADEILREMSGFLASTPRFAFEAEESFDEIPSGEPRVLLTNLRRVAVERPNRFAADAEGDSLSRSVWFDGKAVATYDRAHNTYATIPAAGSIDAALDMLTDEYGVEVPLADLLYSDPYSVLTEAATYSKYLGIHRAAGVPCHHLVFAQPTIEWQIWIDAGDQPLPRKMVITYVREPGEPQYLAAISRWSLSPTFPDSLFRFETPEGAERIDAAALVPRMPGAR
jgi:hypothetical protein